MEITFGGLAFAGLIAAQFLAVIALHRRCFDNETPPADGNGGTVAWHGTTSAVARHGTDDSEGD